MLTWSDVLGYVRLLLRWWAVLALSTGIALGSAWYLSRNEPHYYVTSVTLMVGDTLNTSSPDLGAIEIGSTLAKFYAELLQREVILRPVVARLGLDLPWQALAGMLSTSVNNDTNLLEISVTDSDPVRAAAVANAVAAQLVTYSPNAPEKIAAERKAIEQQITSTEAAVQQIDQKIKNSKDRLAKIDAAVDLKDAQDQLDELETTRARYQESYNQLLQLRNSSTINSLSIFERAEVPVDPLPTKRRVTILTAGLGGLLLAVLAVLLLDRLDERWSGRRDLRVRLGLIDLGAIPYGPPIFMATQQRALLRERAVREAHTQIMLTAGNYTTRTLLVSSPQPNPSRSAFSIDLANIFAFSGHRVLLVDADLATPHLTRLFERASKVTPNHQSQMLEVWAAPSGEANSSMIELWSRLQATPINNVLLLPGHSRNPDGLPALVPSLYWPAAVEALSMSADVIIFDGPSALTSADAALLAAQVDGVILTVDPQSDQRSQVLEAKDRLLRQPGSRLLGAIITSYKRRRGKGAPNKMASAQPQSEPLSPPPAPGSSQPKRAQQTYQAGISHVILTPPAQAAGPSHSSGGVIVTPPAPDAAPDDTAGRVIITPPATDEAAGQAARRGPLTNARPSRPRRRGVGSKSDQDE